MTATHEIVAVLVVPVVGWEGLYEVSETGEVRRLATIRTRPGRWGAYAYADSGRVLRQIVRADGYRLVTLVDGKRREQVRVHRLVLEAFAGPCPDGMEGCHNDGDPANNHRLNLRWDTHQANVADTKRHGRAGHGGLPGARNPSARLTDHDVARVRQRLAAGDSHRVIAADMGVTKGTITKINRGRTWTK